MVLIEIKNGKEGDVYMQASRRYDLITEGLTKNNPDFVARGAPTFISCLNGWSRFTLNRKYITDIVHADEELRIAGAFKDGKQTIVEPLSYNLLCPDFRQDGRCKLRRRFLRFTLVWGSLRGKLIGTASRVLAVTVSFVLKIT